MTVQTVMISDFSQFTPIFAEYQPVFLYSKSKIKSEFILSFEENIDFYTVFVIIYNMYGFWEILRVCSKLFPDNPIVCRFGGVS